MSLVAFIILLALVHHIRGLHPVLLVPGDLSSHIEARYVKEPPHLICGCRNTWFILWLNPLYLIPNSVILDCFVQTMKLNYNIKYRSTFSPDFCEVRVPGFGTVDSILYLTKIRLGIFAYFYDIVHILETKHGYKANKNILGAPYDFRKAPNEMGSFYVDVRYLIEKMYVDNGAKAVIVIGHSMGNLHMVKLFNEMSQQWRDKYVKSFVSISAPYTGSVLAVYSVFAGYHGPIPFIKMEPIRSLLDTWPSTYYLFPNPLTWSTQSIVLTKQGNFTAQNMKSLIRMSNITFATEHYEDVVGSMGDIRAPNVTMHCVYSNGITTPLILDYRHVVFPSAQPRLINGDGDGTVNYDSLHRCISWRAEQSHPIHDHLLNGVSHFPILKDRRTWSIISDIVTHDSAH